MPGLLNPSKSRGEDQRLEVWKFMVEANSTALPGREINDYIVFNCWDFFGVEM
jgi:hypothetical protein